MKRIPNRCSAAGVVLLICTLLLGLAKPSSAGVIVTSSVVDTFAQSISGKGCCGEFPVDNPAPTGGTYGAFSSDAEAIAGPLLEVTTGVAIGRSSAVLGVSLIGGLTTATASLSAVNDFYDMDGGPYLADTYTQFSVFFTLTEDTPFVMSGTQAWHPDDSVALIRITGSPVIIIGPKDDTPHAFAASGTLPPGDYEFTANVGAYAVPPGGPEYYEDSTISATLVLLPEPSSLALLALTIPAVCRRRRRR